MCHLILLLPLVMLPVFWMMPSSMSVPIYSVAVVLAGLVYALALKAMRLPKANEDARLQQAAGRVVTVQPRGRYWIEIHGESWRADSPDVLHEGDRVRVTGRDGLTLHVEKAARAPGPATSDARTRWTT